MSPSRPPSRSRSRLLHLRQRAAISRPSRRERHEDARRMHEGLFGVELLEELDQARKMGWRRGLAAGPAAKADPVHELLHVGEDLELALVAERRQQLLDRGCDLRPVALQLIAPEQMVEHRHVAPEQLRGQLEADQGAGCLGEARVLLGQRIQAAQALGREDEEEPEAEGLEQEAVADASPRAAQELRRTREEREARPDPGQAPGDARRRGRDQRRRHPARGSAEEPGCRRKFAWSRKSRRRQPGSGR
jgi:hypothetical protein